MRTPGSPRTVLAVLVLSSLTLMTLDFRAGQGSPFDAVRDGADAVVGSAQRSAGGAVSALGDLVVDDEVARLREENARLRAQLLAAADGRRRAAELDALLRLTEAGSYSVVPARVSAFGSALGFEHTVTLDVGSNDGVRVGQTVVSGDGLVGRTVRVSPWTSVVLLLTDPGSTVGARLARDGGIGLARGSGDGTLAYTQVDGGPLDVGDALLTTGSETFVTGVPVGRVEQVDPATGALARTARVVPFADLGSLDLVGVVVEPPRSTPRVPIPPVPGVG